MLRKKMNAVRAHNTAFVFSIFSCGCKLLKSFHIHFGCKVRYNFYICATIAVELTIL
jgi:hypothetical protein